MGGLKFCDHFHCVVLICLVRIPFLLSFSMAIPKLKILCLHGKQQNKEVFRTKLGRIPHKLRHVAELTIIDAPHVLEIDLISDNTARTWFFREPDTNYVHVDSLISTLSELQRTWRELGPFDGLLGFSMGGTIASFLAGLDSSKAEGIAGGELLFPGLKFVVCAGAVDIHPHLEASIEKLGLPLRSPFTIPAGIASLHIAGSADTSVPLASSLALSQRFVDPQFIEHDQGHHIPSKALVVGGIVDFVTRQHEAAAAAAVVSLSLETKEEV